MKNKKKILTLCALAFSLLLIYVLSFVFDTGRQRNRSFALLEPSLAAQADMIEIQGIWGRTILSRRNNVWYYLLEAEDHWRELPVRQDRVEELFSSLTSRHPYTQQASSFEARIRLGLTEDTASRITVRGGAGLPLLDLLVGTADALGRDVYTRFAGRSEIYSAEDRLTIFTDSGPHFWIDLRLFPSDTGSLASSEMVYFGTAALFPIGTGPGMVQQAEVVFPGMEDSYAILRIGSNWLMSGDGSPALNVMRVDSWIRTVLDVEGDGLSFIPPDSIDGSITLWLGDNTIRTIHVGPAGDDGSRYAVVGGSNLVYSLPERTVNRLFRVREFFYD